MSIRRRTPRARDVVIPIVDGPVDIDAARTALERMIRLRLIARELHMTPKGMRDRSRERPRRSAKSIHALGSFGPIAGALVRTLRTLRSIRSDDERRIAMSLTNDDVRIAVDGMYANALVPPPTNPDCRFEHEGWHRISDVPDPHAEGTPPGLIVDEHPMNDGYRADVVVSVATDSLDQAVQALRAIVEGHAVSPDEAHETCRAIATAHQRVRYEPGDGRCSVYSIGRRMVVDFRDQGGDGPWEPLDPDDPIIISGSRLVHVSLHEGDVILRRWRSDFDDLLAVDPITALRRAAVVASVHERARAIGMIAPEKTT